MLFKGTQEYPTGLALERAFEAIGGSAGSTAGMPSDTVGKRGAMPISSHSAPASTARLAFQPRTASGG